MSDRPVWERDGRGWPHWETSRFVPAAGLRWHVQQMGQGPVALLVHGTGAATHSWRGLAPLLAERFSVVAPDLPGHGFTDAPPAYRLSLPGMAGMLTELLQKLGASPALAVGHSAGAAIALRMSLDGFMAPRGLVSLNGALLPFRGLPGHLFSPVAKLAAFSSVVPRLFALTARERRVVERLLRDTGSSLEPAGVELYGRLARRSGHVAAALGMMANWDLRALERDLPRLKPPLLLVVGENDRAIRPEEALRVRARLTGASVVSLPGVGHLAHEERPREIAQLVLDMACSADVLHAPEGVRGGLLRRAPSS